MDYDLSNPKHVKKFARERTQGYLNDIMKEVRAVDGHTSDALGVFQDFRDFIIDAVTIYGLPCGIAEELGAKLAEPLDSYLGVPPDSIGFADGELDHDPSKRSLG